MSVDAPRYGAYKEGQEAMKDTEMDELKLELKREARRHSSKLIKKMKQVITVPSLVEDSIHQEVLYATMDGYRATMKTTRNGETNENNERNGNH